MPLNPKSRIFLIVFAIALAAVLSYVLLPGKDALRTAQKDSGIRPQNMDIRPPSLAIAQFYTDDGKAQTLEDYKGRVVLVNLWAIWCPPCVVELPELDALQAQFKDDGFVVLPISIGKPDAKAVREFFEDKKLDHLMVLLDTEREIMGKWPIEGLPVSYLINRDGAVVEKFQGMRSWTSPEMVEKVKNLL